MKNKKPAVTNPTNNLARTIGEVIGESKPRYSTDDIEVYSAQINMMHDDELRHYADVQFNMSFSVCDSREVMLFALINQFKLYWRSHEKQGYKPVDPKIAAILQQGR